MRGDLQWADTMKPRQKGRLEEGLTSEGLDCLAEAFACGLCNGRNSRKRE